MFTLLSFRSPVSLALAAAEAASSGGAVFRKTRTSAIDRDKEMADSDLGLDPADTEGLAWREWNRAEAELEAAADQAWVSAAVTWARAGKETAWPEMPAGMEPAAMVFMPPS